MFRSKLLAAAVAVFLTAGALAPAAAGLDLPAAETAPTLTKAEAVAPEAKPNEAARNAAEPAAPPASKPKGNGFVRAITAPFRALAKLFGGGRKSRPDAAKRPAPPPAPAEKSEAAQAAETRPATQPPDEPRPAENDAPKVSETVAPRVSESPGPRVAERPAAPAPVAERADEGFKLVRPSERAEARPKMWIPVIEGIGKDPLTQGRALLEHGYLSEAISELSVAAAAGANAGANLVEANNLLGLAYDRLGWHREAAEAYQRALTASPRDPVILANLGYSLFLSNDFNGALKRLKQAARLAPGLAVVHNNLGIVHAKRGKYDEAFRSFARATDPYEAHLKVAGILEFERKDKQAIKHYEAALRLQPNTAAVLERLAALYERTGDPAKADMARRALGQPKNPQRTTTGGGG